MINKKQAKKNPNYFFIRIYL